MGRTPQPRVKVHSSGHVPGLQELGPGERGPPILGGSQAEKSEPAEKGETGGSSALDAPQLRAAVSPESLRAAGARRAPSSSLQTPGPQAPTPAAPPAAWCPLKVTADKAPVSASEGTQDALWRELWLWPRRGLRRRAPMEGKQAGRHRLRERGGGPELRARPPLPHLRRVRERDAASAVATGARPARSGPAAAAVPPPRLPALASPHRPVAARRPPSRCRLCHRCTALCPPSSLLPSLPPPSSPARSPLASPNSARRAPRGTQSAVPPAPSSTRVWGGRWRGLWPLTLA